MEPDLSVRIGNIRMKNPIMPASGTSGYGEEISDIIDVSPRICETDAQFQGT